jgi:hypothetical protein
MSHVGLAFVADGHVMVQVPQFIGSVRRSVSQPSTAESSQSP